MARIDIKSEREFLREIYKKVETIPKNDKIRKIGKYKKKKKKCV